MDKTSRQSREFLHYRLEADALCLGERIRGSIFHPCLAVLTYTALGGALKARFPRPYRTIHAAGRFLRDGGTGILPVRDKTESDPNGLAAMGETPMPRSQVLSSQVSQFNARELLTFAPRDRGREVSTLPLQIEYLANVRAEVFVFRNDFTADWPDEFTIQMGAMRSKGFGHCRLTRIGAVPCAQQPQRGQLACRLPEDDAVKDAFGIRTVESPVYGYLFKPDTGGTGHYVRSYFEGTRLLADPVILQSEENGR